MDKELNNIKIEIEHDEILKRQVVKKPRGKRLELLKIDKDILEELKKTVNIDKQQYQELFNEMETLWKKELKNKKK
jgi:hypothetical protein